MDIETSNQLRFYVECLGGLFCDPLARYGQVSSYMNSYVFVTNAAIFVFSLHYIFLYIYICCIDCKTSVIITLDGCLLEI